MADGEAAVVTLHGDLDLRIISARRLPSMDVFSEHIRRCLAACKCYSPSADAANGAPRWRVIASDPYVSLVVAGVPVARTRVIHNSQDPHWDERFLLPLAHSDSHIRFLVKDEGYFGPRDIGTVSIAASRELVDEWDIMDYPMADQAGIGMDMLGYCSMVFT